MLAGSCAPTVWGLLNSADIAEAGLADGDEVKLVSDYDGDDIERVLGGLKLVAYNLPRGTIGGYYPECNVLVPITHHDEMSKTPASKSVPVRIEAMYRPER
jgi:anaerobic selenocysteine-containing dehydrogenase